MRYLSVFLFLFDGIAYVKTFCIACECCKNGTNGCLKYGFKIKCLDGCIDGYYGADCSLPCISNCLNCSNNTTCTTCRAGFYGENCNICPSNCLSCSSQKSCQICKDGFYNGRFLDTFGSSYKNCHHACPRNCTTCTSHSNCTKYGCKEGFAGPDCTKCIDGRFGANCEQTCLENCVICKAETCIKCSPRHYGNKCLSCPLHCSNCNSSNYCTICDHGYYGEVCDSKCPQNCFDNTCNKLDGLCNSCIDGFYGKDCKTKCPGNCLDTKCSVDGKCSSCVGRYYGDNCSVMCGHNCKSCDFLTVSCQTCIDGYHGLECQNACPLGCKICQRSNGYCTECIADFYQVFPGMCYIKQDCDENCKTCLNEFNVCISCIDGKFGQFSGSEYPHCRSECPPSCLYSSCDVQTGQCIFGCKDGYWGRYCKRLCPLKCRGSKCFQENGSCKFGPKCACPDNCVCNSKGKCKSIAGVSFQNVTERCKACPDNCKNNICDSFNGNCTRGCTDRHWGKTCDENCKDGCIKCNQHSGACLVCEKDKYAKDCSETCSTHCNFYNSTRLCDVHNGTCLNGCKTLKRYGKHCENECSVTCLNHTCNWKTGSCLNGCMSNFYGDHCETACSINCIRNSDEIVCNDLNRHCIAGCKVGFHGDRCEQKCNSNCLSNKCEKDTGNCSNGCLEGFTGSTCDKGQIHTVTDDMSTTVIFVASVGALPVMIIIWAVIYLLIRRTIAVKETRNEEIPDEARLNEIIPRMSELDLRDTVYAKPNKRTKNVRESVLNRVDGKTNTSYDPDSEPDTSENVTEYENSEIWSCGELNSDKSTRVDVEKPPDKMKDLEDIKNMKGNKMVLEEIEPHTEEIEYENTYYNITKVQKRRIPLGQMADVVSKKTQEYFVEEFKDLPVGLIQPFAESQKKNNVGKNRYKDIYPYDDTRVVLKDGLSDYINANFIDGYRKKQAYIASLGPTYQYMGDMSAFWRMVWQEKVGKIVMLTNLKEAGAPKCDQYWPNKDYSHRYANIQVTCEGEEIYADYTVRNFVVEKGSERREIVQLQFTAWPDKRIPDDVTSLVEFHQKVHSTQTILDGPTIVHCSAGVGRTGTYIALDILATEGESEGGVDIYACVRKMRLQRVSMVQTAEQYRFLYDAVVHTLTFDCKPVKAINFNEYLNTNGENYMNEQFQKIQASPLNRTEDEIEAIERNKTLNLKNRLGADIPGDQSRPRLRLFRDSDTSDYINAVYVNSFKTVNRYLVTQTPLPGTVDDFLTLIMQEKVSCVIDMEPDDNNKNVGGYYPDYDQIIETDMFTVNAEPGESTDQYKIRKLTIKHQKNGYETTLKHIQFTNWDDRKKVPEEPVKFVHFIKDIELKYLGSEKEGPVLVHCLTGAVRSGLFCVVSILLEKIQIDQEVSVVNSVRQVKHRRHMSIPDKEQYIFCQECINEYLHSFDTYSNFAFKK